MTGGERAPAAPLRTIRLELVPLDPEADAGPLHRAYGDEAVMRWWTRPACADAGETRRYLTECAGLPGARLWTVRSSDGPGRGDVLGLAGLLGAVDVPGLTWLLRRDAWGHGYARKPRGPWPTTRWARSAWTGSKPGWRPPTTAPGPWPPPPGSANGPGSASATPTASTPTK
ncbi:GNAT family N-acetyltransferase [Streptomyces stramineus]